MAMVDPDAVVLQEAKHGKERSAGKKDDEEEEGEDMEEADLI